MNLLPVLVLFDPEDLAVLPQVVGVIRVGLPLADISEEMIEPLLLRIARGADASQPPLAERPRDIAGLLEQLGHRERVLHDGPLAPDRRAQHPAFFSAHLPMAHRRDFPNRPE